MRNVRIGFLLSIFVAAAQQGLADFSGWQGLRVVEQKGRPSLLRAADLDADGREELIVVNSRSSRLDIYSWREDAATGTEEAPDAARPNELPFAPDLEHQELQLESIPRDALAHDLDGDSQPELVVLVSSPNQVLVFQRRADRWEQQYKIELLEGDVPTRRDVLLRLVRA